MWWQIEHSRCTFAVILKSWFFWRICKLFDNSEHEKRWNCVVDNAYNQRPHQTLRLSNLGPQVLALFALPYSMSAFPFHTCLAFSLFVASVEHFTCWKIVSLLERRLPDWFHVVQLRGQAWTSWGNWISDSWLPICPIKIIKWIFPPSKYLVIFQSSVSHTKNVFFERNP